MPSYRLSGSLHPSLHILQTRSPLPTITSISRPDCRSVEKVIIITMACLIIATCYVVALADARYVGFGFGRGRSCTLRGSSTATFSPTYSSLLDDTTSGRGGFSTLFESLGFLRVVDLVTLFEFPSTGFFRLPFTPFIFFFGGSSASWSDKDSVSSGPWLSSLTCLRR